MNDVITVAWKETQELLRMGGGRRGAIFRGLFSVAVFGAIWPWLIGAPFVTSPAAAFLAALNAAMHASALVPDSIPGERERHTLESLLATRLPDYALLLGKIGAIVAYAFGASVVMLFTGWLTVNLKVEGDLLFYSQATITGAIIFTALAAGLMSALGTVVALHSATVKQAQQVLTTGIMLLLFTPAIMAEAWPNAFARLVGFVSGSSGMSLRALGVMAGSMVAVQLILFAYSLQRFKRERLILEKA